MAHRSSFSQHSSFERCARMWFYEKILKIPTVDDMSYAHAGSTIHKVLEEYYKGNLKTLEEAKILFSKTWDSYKLYDSMLRLKKDDYWLMCINGINLNVSCTSTELKIYYPDVIAYIDVVDTNNDLLIDWKSSTIRDENKKEYTQQLKLYAWLYYRKFNKIPKKCTVYYLKYNGSKSELSFEPTMEDIEEIKTWYETILKEMSVIKETKKLPPKCDKCFAFCKFKDICEKSDEELKWKIHHFGSNLKVEGPMTNILEGQIAKKFSYELKDSFFIKQHRPGFDGIIRYWNSRQRSLPIGFFHSIQKTLGDYAKWKKKTPVIEIVKHYNTVETEVSMPDKLLNGRVLRDYQEEAVDAFLDKKIGMLEMSTGSGKTEVFIEIIRRLGIRTLIVVDRVELLKQTKKRIEEALGVKVSQLGGGDSEVGNITVATIQTINKNITDYLGYLSTVNFVIFDECHHCSAPSIAKLSKNLNNVEYRLGCTATPHRSDGNDMAINSVVGDIIYTINSQTLIDKGYLAKPEIVFIKDYLPNDVLKKYERECKEGLINELEDYPKYYNVLIAKNAYRNKKILEIAKKESDKKVLILTKLVEHGKELAEELNCPHITGSSNKKEREELLNDFTHGDVNMIVGTVSIFAEGIDIPRLDIIINATANKGDIKSIQMLGRVMRFFKGKEPMYYDFYDPHRFFSSASRARIKAFRNQGHNVQTINNFL